MASPQLTVSTWVASLALHGLLLLPLVSFAGGHLNQVYDEGAGNDAFKMEQGLTVDVVSFGDATERVELAEVAPTVATPTPPPIIEAKPEEPATKVITATQSEAVTEVAAKEPPPPVVEERQPQNTATVTQAAQVAMVAEKSAGLAQDGGKSNAMSAYVGKIHGALQKAKSGSRNVGVGQVTVGFSIGADGRVFAAEILASSGVAAVDRAAVEIVKSAEFPPLPDVLKGERFNVPLTFRRKSG